MSNRWGIDEQAFWARGAVQESGCIIWTGPLNEKGYGVVAVRIDGRWRVRRVARIAIELDGREIPEGYEADHLCFVRPCMNPSHLDVVTPAENKRRAILHLNREHATHCRHGHAWTTENTKQTKTGRVCRTCHRRTAHQRRDPISHQLTEDGGISVEKSSAMVDNALHPRVLRFLIAARLDELRESLHT